jgi:hypothetical protein
MQFDCRFLNSVVFYFGLFAVNTIFAAPAKAQISCQSGTVRQYPNGSTESCILSSDVTVQVSNARASNFIFPCKGDYYIFFDAQGQFQSCVLSAPLEIRTSNTSQICPAESRVSISNDGNQAVTCRQF